VIKYRAVFKRKGGDAVRTLFSPLHEFLKKGDLVLLSLCLLTSGFGVALIFSATRYNQNNRPVVIQCVAILLGVAVYLLCTFVDFQLFVEKNWKWLFGGSVFFLLLLLTPLGNDHNSGNLNWLDIPGFPLEIQPNEIIKIPFILLLSLQMRSIQNHVAQYLRIMSRCISNKRYQIVIGGSRILLSRSCLSRNLIACYSGSSCCSSVSGYRLIKSLVNII